MLETPVERFYLYVPFEDYAEVKARGACWDEQSKCWYIQGEMAPQNFSPWLGEEGSEAPFGFTSDHAFVAAAQTACWKCRESIEVICIYCESGVDCEMDEPLAQFTVSNVWAMDAALTVQLERWPLFRQANGAGAENGCFANHCRHCGAMQEDYRLHDEPGDVFFSLPRAEPGSVELTPLEGPVQVSGDCGFGV
jgi:hypothetical protein